MSAALRHRVDARPDPSDWGDDDPMTLNEFAQVFGSLYPVTVSAMRTEIGRGRLTATFVGGTYYVTPASVKALFKCHVSPRGRASTSGKGASTPEPAKRSPIDGSSLTERASAGRAAALSVWTKQNDNSPPTSPRNGKRQSVKVIPLRS